MTDEKKDPSALESDSKKTPVRKAKPVAKRPRREKEEKPLPPSPEATLVGQLCAIDHEKDWKRRD